MWPVIRLRFLSAIVLLLVLSLMPMLSVSAPSDQEATLSTISQVEQSMEQAYEAVLDAEEVGADVSGLLARLNVAGGYLAEAHIWLGLGDFENAARLADLCYGAVEGVRNEAFELKREACALWVTDSVVRMTGSIVGVAVVVFGSFVSWHAFKRRYFRRV